ncbi:trypco2 family protein [Catellatospora coxensis]|uniref:Trypsin-co-occurring domain-containing protein n=1 Tax=Catellatospora coxensis TaxID=310354 RepID=A0A8J3P622_9ACTN|nr:trypco2 family protein [Catellatospora coxensis]GIG05012.1 hypothetical protein Cco03nite_17120 [Catellatospora coxensis]
MEIIGLADAVDALRRELAEAQKLGENDPLGFEVGPVEVEFSLVAKKSGGGKVGISFGVIVDVNGSVGREETHRVKVTLTPKDRKTGRRPEINDEVQAIPNR